MNTTEPEMTDTEKLLESAQDMARRRFADPSERTVMELFQALADERDRRALESAQAFCATVH
ncbi:hypothetical protein [Bordetella trematum]|uniref:hypothetical protein n=1 Tax=Bordetella trematum TaxID=123899 RepID=UPI003AF353FF